MNFPRFYKWGGGGVKYTWSFGWLTGKDSDLVCISPNICTRRKEDYTLSPVCSNIILAFIAMMLKVLLLTIDYNLKD